MSVGLVSATFVCEEWAETGEGEVMNSESRNRSRSNVENGAAGREARRRINNPVLRGILLHVLLLDFRSDIPIPRDRG